MPLPSEGSPYNEGSRRRPQPGETESRFTRLREHRVGKIALGVLTHNITIMAAITAVLLGVVANFSLGKGDAAPPAAAQQMTAADLATLFKRAEMSPALAAGVANAKRRAYEEQQKGKKGKKSESKTDSTDEASQGFKTSDNAALAAGGGGGGDTSVAQNQAIAQQLNAAKGWSNCWSSLKALWNRESTWNERAQNASSGAYGIPQSLPGEKMASAGSDWRTNARTQIVWGLSYIDARYGTPCEAWAHSESVGWY
jgi:hypothetical protein